MSELVNIDRCLFYRICAILRQQGFTNLYEGLEMEPISAGSLTYRPVGRAGWPAVFLDANAQPSAAGCKVYVNGGEFSSELYTVNWLKSEVTFTSTPVGPVTADILQFETHIEMAYPEDDWFDQNDLPLVSITNDVQRTEPFGVGVGALKWQVRMPEVSICARNRVESKTMMDILSKFLAKIDYIDMSEHQILTAGGALDPQYSYGDQYREPMNISDIGGSVLSPRVGGHDKEKFRALITFEVRRVS